MTYGVDYPWSKPAAAALRDAGVSFVMRYLSKDPSKNLTLSEANALAAVGIWCGVVWETTAGRALDGRAAGTADAREAVRQAAACGMPSTRPIYFAVDTDTTWSRVAAYFQGVRDVLPAEQIGVYGGIRIIAAAADSGLVSWYWQTEAWSGGRWDPRAHIRQAGMARIGGVEVDNNTATQNDFGQWMPGHPYTQTRTAAPDRRRLDEEDPMIGDIKPGWLADDKKNATFIAIPPQNGGAAGWGPIFLSVGCDFADVLLRVAVYNDQARDWRVTERLKVPRLGGRVGIAIQDGDSKVSIGRVKASDTDTSDTPAGWLLETTRKS